MIVLRIFLISFEKYATKNHFILTKIKVLQQQKDVFPVECVFVLSRFSFDSKVPVESSMY